MGEAGGKSSEVGRALFGAVARMRALAGDPTAEVAVITPSTVNGALARRELALAGNFIRVSFVTPGGLTAALAGPVMRARGLAPEPAGWARATLMRRVREGTLPGGYEDVLAEPGWMAALTAALGMLEAGGVDGGALRGVATSGVLAPDMATRAEMLSALLDELSTRRAGEKLAGPREEADAALAAIAERTIIPANVAKGAVLLGDARGSRLVGDVMRQWLAPRAVVRVEPAALGDLPPAEHGLSLAAPHAERVTLAPPAVSMELVRTPDPTREMAEAVREAQAAIARGVALDRIAIVLPDPGEVVALAEALAQAEIPATFQTGPSLARSPAARFLLHALELALGEGDVRGWYELVRQPALRLGARLGEEVVRRRGRFRRVLSRSGAGRRTDRIIAAIERWASELELPMAGEPESDHDAPESDRAAAAALATVIRTLHGELAELREPRPVGGFARALEAFLTRWWIPSPDARALGRLLSDWGRSLAGPVVSLAELAASLREALQATELLEGSLRDASVRVLSPMQLLGGAFDVVLVTGITEGRFPAKPSEDPIVPDVLGTALNASTGAGLFLSGDRVLLERRRLAAIRSAVREKLWLSAPRVDMLEGRPLLFGSLLFELLADETGKKEKKRLGFKDLERLASERGRRSRPWPARPEDALGGSEHLHARLHGADAAAVRAAVEALVDHPTGRRLLLRARALDRLARGDVDAALAPWAGYVAPAILPCLGLDGTPLAPHVLVELTSEPRAFLLRRMLGAWAAPRLRSQAWTPSQPWVWMPALVDVTDEVLVAPGWTVPRLRGALAEVLERDASRAGVDGADELAKAAGLSGRAIDALVAVRPTTGPLAELSGDAFDSSLPWRVEGGRARREGSALGWVLQEVPGPRSVHKALNELVEAAGQRTRGRVDALSFVDVSGARLDVSDATPFIAAVVGQLQVATRAARLGLYPAEAADADSLAAWADALGEPS